MPSAMDKYLDDYNREAKQHVAELNRVLLLLEKNGHDAQIIDDLFRHAHTLKSMSATMKLVQTEQLCHALENVLDKVKKEQLDPAMCMDSVI